MPTSPAADTFHLQSLPLFKSLSEAQLAKISGCARRRSLQPDEFLFHAGEPAAAIHILVQGQMKLFQLSLEGSLVIMRYANPGDLLGAIALLSESNYPASAQAVENVVVLAWDKITMRSLMERFPQISFNVINILSVRVREYQNRVRELSTERVDQRIARALLNLAGQAGRSVPDGLLIDLPLSRKDLADLTGTTLYTVSRTLSSWESQGYIKGGREKVIIRSTESLAQIAGILPGRLYPSLD